EAGLDAIAEDSVRFVRAAVEAGADGVFFATQAATHDLLTEDEHRQLGVRYDLRVLEATRERTPLVVLHAHGSSLIYDQLLAYPVPALNWHDRAVGPSIAEMRHRFNGLLMGGLDEWGALADGPPRSIRAQAEDAIRQAGDQPLC